MQDRKVISDCVWKNPQTHSEGLTVKVRVRGHPLPFQPAPSPAAPSILTNVCACCSLQFMCICVFQLTFGSWGPVRCIKRSVWCADVCLKCRCVVGV